MNKGPDSPDPEKFFPPDPYMCHLKIRILQISNHYIRNELRPMASPAPNSHPSRISTASPPTPPYPAHSDCFVASPPYKIDRHSIAHIDCHEYPRMLPHSHLPLMSLPHSRAARPVRPSPPLPYCPRS